jgi:hypothetical protein
VLFDRYAKLGFPQVTFDRHIELIERILHDAVRVQSVDITLKMKIVKYISKNTQVRWTRYHMERTSSKRAASTHQEPSQILRSQICRDEKLYPCFWSVSL